jgi:hypothetical protein
MILHVTIPTIYLIISSFSMFYDTEFSIFYSLNMILIIIVIILNFSVANFLMRLTIPLISIGMMKNKARFQQIY